MKIANAGLVMALVVLASCSGTNAHRGDREAEVEVLAEAAGLHLFFEVAVRRGDDAHVDLPVVIFTEPPNGARLERTQEA